MVRTGRPSKYADEETRQAARKESKRKYSQSRRGKETALQRRAHLRKDQAAIRSRLGHTNYAVHHHRYNPIRYPADIVRYMTTKYPKRPIRRLPGFVSGFLYQTEAGVKQWMERNVDDPDFNQHSDLEAAFQKHDYSTFVGLVDGYCLRRLLETFHQSYLKLKHRRNMTGACLLTDDLIDRLLALDADSKKFNALWKNHGLRYGERTRELLHLIRFWKYAEITLLRTELHQRYHSIHDSSLEQYRHGHRIWQTKWMVSHREVANMIGGVWEEHPDARSEYSLDTITTNSIADAFESEDSDDADCPRAVPQVTLRDDDLESEASHDAGDRKAKSDRRTEQLDLCRVFIKENMVVDKALRLAENKRRAEAKTQLST